VADQLKKAIFSGQLNPGDRLPSERELCEMFGVGRPAIREALRTLKVLGLIEVNPGIKATVVKEADITHYMEAIREHFSLLIRVSQDTINHLMEVRTYIDLGIAHSAAQNATQEELDKLEGIIEEMVACGRDFYAYFPLAAEFHTQMALATKNSLFYVMEKLIYDLLIKGYMPLLEDVYPEGPARLIELNRRVLRAVRSKDPRAIDLAMEEHAAEERFLPFPDLLKDWEKQDQ